MIEFSKIETLYDRDEKTRMVQEGVFRKDYFPRVAGWDVTEKIDGTNVRIHLSPEGKIRLGGRSDDAGMPMILFDHLQDTFLENSDKMKEVLWRGEPCDVTLFGEGYGPKIQKGGGDYRRDISFRLFDVKVDSWWLLQKDVIDIAEKLEIKTAPVLFDGPADITAIVSLVKNGFDSSVAQDENDGGVKKAEGIVARSPFVDRAGDRVMFKLKTVDFTGKFREKNRRGAVGDEGRDVKEKKKCICFGYPDSGPKVMGCPVHDPRHQS